MRTRQAAPLRIIACLSPYYPVLLLNLLFYCGLLHTFEREVPAGGMCGRWVADGGYRSATCNGGKGRAAADGCRGRSFHLIYWNYYVVNDEFLCFTTDDAVGDVLVVVLVVCRSGGVVLNGYVGGGVAFNLAAGDAAA